MKDRVPKYPGRVKLTPVSGTENTYDMVRADEPEEVGTPINKQTLLTDETAELLGLDPDDNPTPNDAFREFAISSAAKAGDLTETTRTDLGDRWLLCNGDIVPVGYYPKLREVLPYNTGWRRIAPLETYSTIRPITRNGQWAFLDVFQNTSTNGKTAILYDANTDTCTEITCPTIDTEIRYGIFGLTYDGSRYILGVNEDYNDETAPKVHLFTSTDLVNWTDAYQFEVTQYYEPYDFTFDGVSLLVAADYYTVNSVYSTYVYSVDSGLTSHTTLIRSDYDSEHYFRVFPGGYWALSDGTETTYYAYKAGTTTMAFSSYLSESGRNLAFFSDKYWITTADDDTKPTHIEIIDISAGSVSYIGLYNFGDTAGTKYLYGAEYNQNTNEWALYLRYSISSSSGIEYYIAYISADADPSDTTQYRIVQIESLPETLSYEQMAPDRSQMRIESTSERYLRDPNQKYLPEHDGDTYKYIYTG